MCLNQTQQLAGHLYLSGVWYGMDLRIGTKKIKCGQKRLDYVLNLC